VPPVASSAPVAPVAPSASADPTTFEQLMPRITSAVMSQILPPTAVGAAIARKITNKSGKFYCIVGDGECNEGSIWESVMLAVAHKLDNLICIIDYNQSQIRSLPLDNLKNKFQSFGCNSIEVNGHDITEISNSLSNIKTNMPLFIIANTIKGKGISQLESNMFTWHHKAPTFEEYTNFIQEIYEK
jgi:transketolase